MQAKLNGCDLWSRPFSLALQAKSYTRSARTQFRIQERFLECVVDVERGEAEAASESRRGTLNEWTTLCIL